MALKKGDVVKINKRVVSRRTYYSNEVKKELRFIEVKHLTGIVLGYSFLKTGKIRINNYGDIYDNQNELIVEKSHKVIVIEPIEQENSWYGYSTISQPSFKTNRYLEPIRCFEDDLELIQEL